jgi:hypothetical protein
MATYKQAEEKIDKDLAIEMVLIIDRLTRVFPAVIAEEIAFAIRGYVDGHLRAGNYQAFLEADKP